MNILRASILALIAPCLLIAAEPEGLSATEWESIQHHMISEHISPKGPGLSAFVGFDEPRALPLELGWFIPGFGAKGDRVWEVHLVENHTYVNAIYLYNSTTSITRTLFSHPPGNVEFAESTQVSDIPDVDLESLTINTPIAANQAVSTQQAAVLIADRRVVVRAAIRLDYALPGFSEVGSWIWSCHVIAGENQVFGFFLVDAATGAVRPILVAP